MLQDLRLAIRLFRRTPLATSVALLSIALSVGVTAVVFTAIKTALLDALPYTHPESLVQIRSENPGAPRSAARVAGRRLCGAGLGPAPFRLTSNDCGADPHS